MSKARAKGTRFESEVCDVFRPLFPHVERRASNGVNDRGDLTGLGPGIVVECKATTRIDLGEFMAETEREAKNAGAEDMLLVIKRRGRNASQSYAVMPLEQAVRMLGELDGRT